MRRNWKVLSLPAAALSLAAAVLLGQNVHTSAGDAPAPVQVAPPLPAAAADAGPVTVATWRETGNTRGSTGSTSTTTTNPASQTVVKAP